MTSTPPQTPKPQGLYDPAYEHDSCGVAFVADVAGRRSHDVVRRGLSALRRMDHRGARGAEPNTGDGAGLLIQVPDELCRAVAGVELPPPGQYATGLAFLPVDDDRAEAARRVLEKFAFVEGARVLGVLGEEGETGGVPAGRRQLDARDGPTVLVGHLDHDAGTVAGVGLGAPGAAVVHAAQRPEALGHDLV